MSGEGWGVCVSGEPPFYPAVVREKSERARSRGDGGHRDPRVSKQRR